MCLSSSTMSSSSMLSGMSFDPRRVLSDLNSSADFSESLSALEAVLRDNAAATYGTTAVAGVSEEWDRMARGVAHMRLMAQVFGAQKVAPELVRFVASFLSVADNPGGILASPVKQQQQQQARQQRRHHRSMQDLRPQQQQQQYSSQFSTLDRKASLPLAQDTDRILLMLSGQQELQRQLHQPQQQHPPPSPLHFSPSSTPSHLSPPASATPIRRRSLPPPNHQNHSRIPRTTAELDEALYHTFHDGVEEKTEVSSSSSRKTSEPSRSSHSVQASVSTTASAPNPPPPPCLKSTSASNSNIAIASPPSVRFSLPPPPQWSSASLASSAWSTVSSSASSQPSSASVDPSGLTYAIADELLKRLAGMDAAGR